MAVSGGLSPGQCWWAGVSAGGWGWGGAWCVGGGVMGVPEGGRAAGCLGSS